MMNESPVSNDGKGIIGIVVVLLAAVLYFGLPPSYVQLGPLEVGQLANTTCHGMGHDGSVFFRVCK